MKINLPVPQPKDVATFKRIVLETQGVELSDREALDQCSSMVQYVFLTDTVFPILQAIKRKSNEGQE